MQNEIALCYKAPIQGPTVVFTDTHTQTHSKGDLIAATLNGKR